MSIRRWLKNRKRGPMLYPVHGHASYTGEPLTFFRCRVCGTESIGSPWSLPSSAGCPCRWGFDGEEHEPDWEPLSGPGEAFAFVSRIESTDFARRVVQW